MAISPFAVHPYLSQRFKCLIFRVFSKIKAYYIKQLFLLGEGALSYSASRIAAPFIHSLTHFCDCENMERVDEDFPTMCTSPTRALCLFFPGDGEVARACGASLSLHFPVCKEGSIVASVPENAVTSGTSLQNPSVLDCHFPGMQPAATLRQYVPFWSAGWSTFWPIATLSRLQGLSTSKYCFYTSDGRVCLRVAGPLFLGSLPPCTLLNSQRKKNLPSHTLFTEDRKPLE